MNTVHYKVICPLVKCFSVPRFPVGTNFPLFTQSKPCCVTLSQKKAGLLDILRPNKGKELTNMAAINMNKDQLQQMIQGDKPVLVDFWAPWCGYCRRIGPAYEKIAEEYGDRLVAAKINIDEEGQLAEAAGVEVIPTLILYKNGKAVDSVVNPGSKAAIDQFIQTALAK